MQGVVFNIQRHSIHDGPGIRSTVFLKGCNLRCLWCQNPESIDTRPQLQFYPRKCIGCAACYSVCPAGALRYDNDDDNNNDKRVYIKNACRRCGACAEACYAEALILRGRIMTADDVMTELDKDRHYYETSNGGVTFSGGEPLLQIGFLKTLLLECKNRGYHTAVDTAGNVSWHTVEGVMPYVDLWLYDIKLADGEKHKKATGATNRAILANLKHLASAGSNIIIRVPIVPGMNDGAGEAERIADIASYISDIKNIRYVELLPLNHMAEGKYDSLGMDYKAKEYPPPSSENLNELAKIFMAKGLTVK